MSSYLSDMEQELKHGSLRRLCAYSRLRLFFPKTRSRESHLPSRNARWRRCVAFLFAAASGSTNCAVSLSPLLSVSSRVPFCSEAAPAVAVAAAVVVVAAHLGRRKCVGIVLQEQNKNSTVPAGNRSPGLRAINRSHEVQYTISQASLDDVISGPSYRSSLVSKAVCYIIPPFDVPCSLSQRALQDLCGLVDVFMVQ